MGGRAYAMDLHREIPALDVDAGRRDPHRVSRDPGHVVARE
jgi:hypothetical protein